MLLFAPFLELRKPILAAINGPAIGAGVTQATLCDSIVSSPQAKFVLPFGTWHVSPEGCSSVHLTRLIGKSAAQRMLGAGWTPEALTAKSVGLVSQVVEQQQLLAAADKGVHELLTN